MFRESNNTCDRCREIERAVEERGVLCSNCACDSLHRVLELEAKVKAE